MAIVEAFRFVLNKVVIICVMNQSQGHWLLIDAFGASNAFDVELIIFQNNMQVEVVKVIKPFL
jgi:hypothetical protein